MTRGKRVEKVEKKQKPTGFASPNEKAKGKKKRKKNRKENEKKETQLRSGGHAKTRTLCTLTGRRRLCSVPRGTACTLAHGGGRADVRRLAATVDPNGENQDCRASGG